MDLKWVENIKCLCGRGVVVDFPAKFKLLVAIPDIQGARGYHTTYLDR